MKRCVIQNSEGKYFNAAHTWGDTVWLEDIEKATHFKDIRQAEEMFIDGLRRFNQKDWGPLSIIPIQLDVTIFEDDKVNLRYQ